MAFGLGILGRVSPIKQQSEIWRDISLDDLLYIKLGHQTYFTLSDNGETSWGNKLPDGLHSKLWGRQKWLPQVDIVALDPSNRGYYYVQFTDGTYKLKGPDTLIKHLKSNKTSNYEVDVLCFAPNDGWFVKWTDGYIESMSIPKGLENQVYGRYNSMPEDSPASTVEYMSVGQKGEWFVRYANGDWRCGAQPKELDEAIGEVHADNEEVVIIEFGSSGNWVLIFEEF